MRARSHPVRIARLLAPLVPLAMLAAACGDDDGDAISDVPEADDTGPGTDTGDSTDDGPSDGAPGIDDGDDPGTDPGDVITLADPVLSDGVWEIGDAGTVEFRVVDGALELVDVVANDGWSFSVDVEAPDEIEVDFRQGPFEYEVEIELDDGILEIEIDLDIDPAEPGTFELGGAGTVEIAVDGRSVTLVDLSPADGWTVTDEDTSDGEVEIDLRRDDVHWEFDAEVDDGRLQVEIDFEIEGRFPA